MSFMCVAAAYWQLYRPTDFGADLEIAVPVRRHAEIAGAGFAGLIAAIALQQRGWSVRVHEAGRDLRAYPGGVLIWENGLHVLKAVGAYDEVMSSAHEAAVIETRHDNRIIADHAFTPDKGSRMLSMTRQHLYAAILHAARREGIDIVTQSEVVGALPSGVLIMADGHQVQADLVIGADGVKSKVRDALGLLRERQAYWDGLVGSLVPRSKDELGPGNWDHVIDFWSLGPRPLRILYMPCSNKELYLALMAAVDDREASSLPIRHDIWTRAFPQLAPAIRKISLRARFEAYETSKLIRWSSGRAAVIGDAAHAMHPTLAQGISTSMVNALALAVAVEEMPRIEEALELWEQRERPLTDYTQNMAAEMNKARAMSRGEAWNTHTLRAAVHVPTGIAPLLPPARVPAC